MRKIEQFKKQLINLNLPALAKNQDLRTKEEKINIIKKLISFAEEIEEKLNVELLIKAKAHSYYLIGVQGLQLALKKSHKDHYFGQAAHFFLSLHSFDFFNIDFVINEKRRSRKLGEARFKFNNFK